MKKRLPLMMIVMVLVLNSSCTNDDYESQAVNATSKKSIMILPSNINESASLKVSDSLKVNFDYETPDPEGDPSLPKDK